MFRDNHDLEDPEDEVEDVELADEDEESEDVDEADPEGLEELDDPAELVSSFSFSEESFEPCKYAQATSIIVELILCDGMNE